MISETSDNVTYHSFCIIVYFFSSTAMAATCKTPHSLLHHRPFTTQNNKGNALVFREKDRSLLVFYTVAGNRIGWGIYVLYLM